MGNFFVSLWIATHILAKGCLLDKCYNVKSKVLNIGRYTYGALLYQILRYFILCRPHNMSTSTSTVNIVDISPIHPMLICYWYNMSHITNFWYRKLSVGTRYQYWDFKHWLKLTEPQLIVAPNGYKTLEIIVIWSIDNLK